MISQPLIATHSNLFLESDTVIIIYSWVPTDAESCACLDVMRCVCACVYVLVCVMRVWWARARWWESVYVLFIVHSVW